MITKFNFIEKLLFRFDVLPQPLMDGALITTSRALISAVKPGLIDELEQNPKTITEIAGNTGISER